MNWKLVILGGLAFYVVTMIVGMFIFGPLVHEGVLDPIYQDNAEYWRPELNEDPPDMAALMPRWIAVGLLTAFVVAGLYGIVRRCFDGPGWKRGMKWGLCLGVFNLMVMLGWSGVFNLPMQVWYWWAAEGLVLYACGGAAMGWVGAKWANA